MSGDDDALDPEPLLRFIAGEAPPYPDPMTDRELVARAFVLANNGKLLAASLLQPLRFMPFYALLLERYVAIAPYKPLSRREIAFYVDQLLRGGLPLGEARVQVARSFRKTRVAVERAHQLYGRCPTK